MQDIIHLLPENVANQIAAGEVVQRPASVVKELIENAVDAGASSIKLLIKEAGKTLIQVIDNGSGMSETDAKMCFERHATSKIKKAEDLFSINSFGFRGEAMASIAAVAQVELKTKKEGQELGTHIQIEGSQVKLLEATEFNEGTSIAVKNLFYNIPARRNFLKTDQIELRHIIDEFQRVAMAYPSIEFYFYNKESILFHLPKNNLRQRIVDIFGTNFNQKLVPVEEETQIVTISGFVGKPEFAKKTRGEQFFFVNGRFIKSSFLNNAIQAAFEEFIPSGNFPSYFLKLQVPANSIDINIHPTKTEIKFEDEKSIYAILRSSVRQGLGKFHITPTLDFNQETSFNLPLSYLKDQEVKIPEIKVNSNFNPFDDNSPKPSLIKKASYSALSDSFNKEFGLNNNSSSTEENNLKNWDKLFESQPDYQSKSLDLNVELPFETIQNSIKLKYQLQNTYILTNVKEGILLIDQNRAHERVLYENYLSNLNNNKSYSQQLLFPVTLHYHLIDFEIVKELCPDFNAIGLDISEFGKNTFVVNGIPLGMKETEISDLIDSMLENFKLDLTDIKSNKNEFVAKSFAKKIAMKQGVLLNTEEMDNLIDQLFACNIPFSDPNGRPTTLTITMKDLAEKFIK